MLVKIKEKGSNKHGTEPLKRSIEELLDKGFLIIDKDAGPTSHETTDNVKKILGVEKAGHSGTLDPKVTGVLLVGLGKATRLMEYMLLSDKEYVCLMYVHKEITEKQVKEVLKKFTGTIKQTPPLISAVKRQERERTIYEIKLLDFKEGKNVLFKVRCQHGTYIRKLCSDIGESLGTGAHMKELRRTKAGPFTEDEQLISLDKLRNLYELYKESEGVEKETFEKELRYYLRPMEECLAQFKKVKVRDSAVNSLCHGSDLAIPGLAELEEGIEMGDEVALLTMKGELIGMGTAYLTSKDVMKKKKGAFVKTNKVFMQRDTYPETWEFLEKSKEE
jgi:H/ACA ribonucleoprotein complex subunit 4